MKLLFTSLLIVLDFIFLIVAYGSAYFLRYESGFFSVNLKGDFLSAALLLSLSWIIIFAIMGHYKTTILETWNAIGKRVTLTVLLGGLILFWLTYDADRPLPPGRFVLVAYGVAICLLVPTGRIFIYKFRKKLWKSGKSLSRTAIIGYGKWMDTLVTELTENKELGDEFIGSIALHSDFLEKLPTPVLGIVHDLEKIIVEHQVQSVILAWEHGHTDELIQILIECSHKRIEVQVVPDLRDATAGWTRLAPREDVPLYVVTTNFHPQWERLLKRAVGGTNA